MTTGANQIRLAGTGLPDPPERNPDEVTSITYLHGPGTAEYLRKHFNNPDTTLVTADLSLVGTRQDLGKLVRYPDLLIAFDVDPRKYESDNGYIVDEQGKPPDLVLEVASPSTARADTGVKREFYESLDILEYWRFDHTGNNYGARLAGDRLVEGKYVPISIDTLAANVHQGYSRALNLFLRWEEGHLVFIDPGTNAPILTYDDQERRAAEEATLRQQETARRRQAEELQRQAEELRQQAEDRVRQLEEENRRLRGE